MNIFLKTSVDENLQLHGVELRGEDPLVSWDCSSVTNEADDVFEIHNEPTWGVQMANFKLMVAIAYVMQGMNSYCQGSQIQTSRGSLQQSELLPPLLHCCWKGV